MALGLPKDLACGVTAAYHRILSLSVQYNLAGMNEGTTGPVVTLEIGEYVSKEARDSGAVPVRTEVRSFMATDDIRAFLRPIYNLLAANPDLGYAGATET